MEGEKGEEFAPLRAIMAAPSLGEAGSLQPSAAKKRVNDTSKCQYESGPRGSAALRRLLRGEMLAPPFRQSARQQELDQEAPSSRYG
jgi:hypothetical protein